MPDPSAILGERLADLGPRYMETPVGEPPFAFPAEPWNTATAALFVLIALFWFVKLRGRLFAHPMLAVCLPILLAGGIGGTVYHGTRSSPTWFLLDVVPIYILGVLVSIRMWVRVRPRPVHLLLAIATLVLMNVLHAAPVPRRYAINISYASLALLMLTPIVVVLLRTGFRHAGWVWSCIALFVVGWVCRLAENWVPDRLPMGTHWLWHTFGAMATACLSYYLYRVETATGEPGGRTSAPTATATDSSPPDR